MFVTFCVQLDAFSLSFVVLQSVITALKLNTFFLSFTQRLGNDRVKSMYFEKFREAS